MAKEIIERIRQAEAEAESIEAAAAREAKEMKEKAVREAAAERQKALERAEAENASALAQAKARCRAMMDEALALEAEEEARICLSANEKRKQAVREMIAALI